MEALWGLIKALQGLNKALTFMKKILKGLAKATRVPGLSDTSGIVSGMVSLMFYILS